MGDEHNWFNVTTWADRDWNAALEVYWNEMRTARSYPALEAKARARLDVARADYRHRVLSWYRKLLLPMRPGDAVPNRVAELLAEEWDEATRSAP